MAGEKKWAKAPSANRSLHDTETVELEQKVKKLQEDFSSLPKILIKRTLCGDDINGDLAKARQHLQKFTQVDNPLLKSPVAAKHVTRCSKGKDLDDSSAVMTQNHSEEQNWSTEGKMLCNEKWCMKDERTSTMLRGSKKLWSENNNRNNSFTFTSFNNLIS